MQTIQKTSLRVQYSLAVIQEEVRHWVRQGLIHRQQSIYTLCRFIPVRDWQAFEQVLEQEDFMLRDRIGDLLGQEVWLSD